MAFLGAAVYDVQHAPSVLSAAVGLVEAVFWPAALVYHVLLYLKM
jgi:hypothetical protein